MVVPHWFDMVDKKVVDENVDVWNEDMNDVVRLSVLHEIDGQNITCLLVDNPHPDDDRRLNILLTAEQRKKLIEALLDEQEKFD